VENVRYLYKNWCKLLQFMFSRDIISLISSNLPPAEGRQCQKNVCHHCIQNLYCGQKSSQQCHSFKFSRELVKKIRYSSIHLIVLYTYPVSINSNSLLLLVYKFKDCYHVPFWLHILFYHSFFSWRQEGKKGFPQCIWLYSYYALIHYK